MQDKPRKIVLELYDIDGSLFHKFKQPGTYKNEDILGWLIESNQEFFNKQIEDIKQKQYDKVIVGFGTNRGDKKTDVANIHSGGSCAPALPIVQSHLSSHLKCPVVLDPFWPADIYSNEKTAGNKKAGDSYKDRLKELTKDAQGITHADWVFDHSKVSLIFAHAQRVAKFHPNDFITINFYDDSDDIRNKLYSFFSSETNRKLLPDNIILNIFPYNGSLGKALPPIQGTGPIDSHYEWSVRFFSSMTYFFNSGADEDQDIKTAERLKTYHNDDHYHASGHKMQMKEPNSVGVDRYLKFREQQLHKLASEPSLGDEPYYTTAAELVKEGLLLKEYNLQTSEHGVKKDLQLLEEQVQKKIEQSNALENSQQENATSDHAYANLDDYKVKVLFKDYYSLLVESIDMLQTKYKDLDSLSVDNIDHQDGQANNKQSTYQKLRSITRTGTSWKKTEVNNCLKSLNGLRKELEIKAFGEDLEPLRDTINKNREAYLKDSTNENLTIINNKHKEYKEKLIIKDETFKLDSNTLSTNMFNFKQATKELYINLNDQLQQTSSNDSSLSYWLSLFKQTVVDGIKKLFSPFDTINPYDNLSTIGTAKALQKGVLAKFNVFAEKHNVPELKQDTVTEDVKVTLH